MANTRRDYCQRPTMRPGIRARGWLRRVHIVLDDASWREFREYLARDRISMEAMLTRTAEEYMRECRAHYQRMSEEESAAVGGDPKIRDEE